MVQKDKVYEETLKYKGFFNYTELYNYCYTWLKEEGYLISEDEYTEKISGEKEVKLKWKAKKKITDYYRNNIELSWHIIGMTEEEVSVNGKKEKMNKGDLKIKFEAVLEKDYEENWEKHAFWKFMRGVYDKYIIRTTNDAYEERLINKTISFIEEIKAYLNIEGKR